MTLDGVVKCDVVGDAIVKLRDTPAVLGDFFPKVAEEDAMLLGRVSYQEWAGYWPTSPVERFASHINRVPKFVVSRTLASAPSGAADRVTVISGSLREAVTTLKQRPGNNIGIHASPSLVEAMLHADLLDELRLEIYPVVAGSGMRLLRKGGATKLLRLAHSKVTSNGVAVLTYRPLREGDAT